MRATATYTPTKWVETPFGKISKGHKMTKASVDLVFDGDIEGNGTIEYLMFYKHFDAKHKNKSLADYVGLMKINGKLHGRPGSFVLEDRGTYKGGAAKSTLAIIEGSGTGALKKISGSAKYKATKKGVKCEIKYELK